MFVWSDAWLLLALIYAREPADRDQIRAVGDFINRAIFTEEELDGGLGRLLPAGYVVETEGRFAPSAHVLDWYSAVTGGRTRENVFKKLQQVQNFLGVVVP